MTHRLGAIVTGASSGIGKAIAIALAADSHSLCVVGRNAERLDVVAREVRTKAHRVLPILADLTVEAEIHELAQQVRREFNRVDVLVHCAGEFSSGSLQETPVSQFDRLYQANVRAPYALTRAILPLLKAQRGQIVFVNSSRGLKANGQFGPYTWTQHALKALADTLRQEVNAEGIRVLSLYPGRTATPRTGALFEAEGRVYRPELLLQSEDVARVVMSALELPRTAELTDIELRPLIKSY